LSPYAAGGLAMLAICVIYRYVPMWLALPINFGIWLVVGSLVGAFA
jgi:hypothetical protein